MPTATPTTRSNSSTIRANSARFPPPSRRRLKAIRVPVIDSYLTKVLERKGSDLHFIAGDPSRVRLYGELITLDPETLTAEMVKTTIYEIMPKLARERFEQKDGTDFAYTIPAVARFRVNVLRQLNGMGAGFRVIPSSAKTADELNLPAAVRQLSRASNGLTLVTGKTGSGKSTTLAALIDDINTREKGHILTIEDPIEFVHKRKRCLIRQGKMDQLENAMMTGGALGMRTMDTAIQQLFDQKQISGKDAFQKAINKSRFEQYKEAS